MTTQRERFEASEVAQRLILEKGLCDEYLTSLARTAWRAWQEAERQMIERCAEVRELSSHRADDMGAILEQRIRALAAEKGKES